MARVPGAQTALEKVADLVGRRAAEGPDAERATRTRVVAEVRDAAGDRVSRVELTGADPYAFTAEMLAWGAVRAAAGDVRGTGALGPVQAFGPEALAEAAADAGIA